MTLGLIEGDAVLSQQVTQSPRLLTINLVSTSLSKRVASLLIAWGIVVDTRRLLCF